MYFWAKYDHFINRRIVLAAESLKIGILTHLFDYADVSGEVATDDYCRKRYFVSTFSNWGCKKLWGIHYFLVLVKHLLYWPVSV